MRGSKVRRDETFSIDDDKSREITRDQVKGHRGDFCKICGHWAVSLVKLGSKLVCRNCKERDEEFAFGKTAAKKKRL